jgi:hypothetical protein
MLDDPDRPVYIGEWVASLADKGGAKPLAAVTVIGHDIW